MNPFILKEYNVIGLMSGTSLDGLDIAFCHFAHDNNTKWHFRILKAETISYSPEWKRRLSEVENASSLEFIKTHTELGHFMGRQVAAFIKKHDLFVNFIASHGHTIFHQPALGFTTQIGEGNAIVAETGLPVVCDFRLLDVALGGQGAPLVPAGDEYLFHEYDFCLNLGGIANISYWDNENNRIAFDIVPCNMALNELAALLHLEYDPEGRNARKGFVNKQLFDKLNALEFYRLPNPKSLGKEWYLECLRPVIWETSISIEDKLCTVTEHIAYQISQAIVSNPEEKMIVTGGGAFNCFLIERLQSFLKQTVVVPDKLLVNYKEALIFAFLGVLRFRHEMNCLPKVTGAKEACCGGSIMGIF